MKKQLSIFTLLFLLASALYAFQFGFKSKDTYTTKISTDNLLAISWQNAFCQTHQNKRECRNIKPSHYSASHFTLHGLWPQPRSRQNCKGKRKVYLPKPLYQELLQVMPAAKSGLHNHEWKKHGTCYGKSPEEYFKDSISLLKQVNQSAVRDLFAHNVGKTITKEQLNRAFDKAFGKGSGRKVKMVCNKGLITELWINLKGKINEKSSLSELIKQASAARGGCQKGKVDAVGF
jgi:ribonuclease T2